MNPLSQFLEVLRPAYEFIYPPTCLACDSHLEDSGQKVCSRCWSSVRRLSIDEELYCEKRGEIIAGGNISGLASVFHFEKDGTLQTLVHHLKYDEMTSVGVELGKFVGESLRPMLGDVAIDALVPVPLHSVKERERGYNQSEFICKGIREITRHKIIPHLLKRIRHTKTQTKLNAHERRENVADAFELNRRYTSLVEGNSFLLVDDIITTGATIRECAKVLKESGATSVFAASVAVPDREHLP